MDNEFNPSSKGKDIGKTWMLTNGTLLSKVEIATSKSIIKEVEFAYLYFSDVCKILGFDGSEGGVIVEKKHSSLVMGNFASEHGNLVSADGEWIEGAEDCFDYCLARI